MNAGKDWSSACHLRADVLFCPSYNLVADGHRLTVMNLFCVERTLQLAAAGCAPSVILSNAFPGPLEEPNREERLKLEIADCFRVSRDRVKFIRVQTDSAEEVNQAVKEMMRLSARSAIVVAEKHHLPRLSLLFACFAPWTWIHSLSVSCPPNGYEMPYRPRPVRPFGWQSLKEELRPQFDRVSMASRLLWIARQFVLFQSFRLRVRLWGCRA